MESWEKIILGLPSENTLPSTALVEAEFYLRRRKQQKPRWPLCGDKGGSAWPLLDTVEEPSIFWAAFCERQLCWEIPGLTPLTLAVPTFRAPGVRPIGLLGLAGGSSVISLIWSNSIPPQKAWTKLRQRTLPSASFSASNTTRSSSSSGSDPGMAQDSAIAAFKARLKSVSKSSSAEPATDVKQEALLQRRCLTASRSSKTIVSISGWPARSTMS